MKNIIEAKSKKLPVMEAFYTIQGEGYHTGKAAFFIRIAGCDVGCHWCDVKESWPLEGHPEYTVLELVEMASSYPSRLVIITGGEPFLYDMTELTDGLRKAGFQVHVETAGVHPLSGNWDWICLSPKKFVPARDEYYNNAHEIKVIVYNKSDFEWLKTFSSKINSSSRHYLQPEWSKKDKMMPEIVEFVKTNPSWEISLQTHKYLQIP
jgi:organic radical activating enzyme